MLIGIELLDTLRQNEITDEKTLAKKCGYATVTKEWCRENLINTILRSSPSGKGRELVKTQLFPP